MLQKETTTAFVALAMIAVVTGLQKDFNYIYTLSEANKQSFVDSHNHFRRMVSPEAADMRLLTWDQELADLADSFVRRCSFVHSPESFRVTSVFDVAGENLYSGSPTFSNTMTETGISKDWFDEEQYYNITGPSCVDGEMCGHYKQLVWANTYKVGCAMANCDAIEDGTPPMLICCHYGPGGNIVDNGVEWRPYTIGTPCSQCGSDDGCIDKLCNNTARDIPFTTTTKQPTTVATTQSVVTTKTDSTTVMDTTTATEKISPEQMSTPGRTQNTSALTTASTNTTACSANACGADVAVNSCIRSDDGNITCTCNSGYQLNSTSNICAGANNLKSNAIFLLVFSVLAHALRN